MAMEAGTGEITIVTLPWGNGGSSYLVGTGPSITVDGVADTSVRIQVFCNPPATFPWPNPQTCTEQRLKIWQNGNLYFEDMNTTYVVTREARPDLGLWANGDPWLCVDEATGTGSVEWGITLTNLRWNNTMESLIMDWELTADPGVIVFGGDILDYEPPFRRPRNG